MKCKKCGGEYKDKQLDCHHIVPRCFGGKDEDGTLILCKRCHKEIHSYINFLELVTNKAFIYFTERWLKGEVVGQHNPYPICPKCKNEEQRLHIDLVSANEVTLSCSNCGYEVKSKKWLEFLRRKEYRETFKEIQRNFVEENYIPLKEEIEDEHSI
jgi:hypothetical protein